MTSRPHISLRVRITEPRGFDAWGQPLGEKGDNLDFDGRLEEGWRRFNAWMKKYL